MYGSKTQPEIVANLSHAIPNVVKALNKGWKSVQALHIKTPDSVALPLYNAQPNDEEDLKLLDSTSASKNSKNGKRRKKGQQEATDVEVSNADADISPKTKRTRRKNKQPAQ